MAGDGGDPGRGGWGQPKRLLEGIAQGGAFAGPLLALLTLALVIGTTIGAAGIAAIVIGFAGLGLLGWWLQVRARGKLLERAFPWRGTGVKADPIKHFGVKYWSGFPRDEPPPFVKRTAMPMIEAGLNRDRLVLVTGPRTSI